MPLVVTHRWSRGAGEARDARLSALALEAALPVEAVPAGSPGQAWLSGKAAWAQAPLQPRGALRRNMGQKCPRR